MLQGWCWSCILYSSHMVSEGKAVTLQALLQTGCRPQPRTATRYLQREGHLTQFRQRFQYNYWLNLPRSPSYFALHTAAGQTWPTWAVRGLSMYPLILYHPLKTEDEMGLLHDFGRTLQRQIQPSHRLLNKTWGMCSRVGCVCSCVHALVCVWRVDVW